MAIHAWRLTAATLVCGAALVLVYPAAAQMPQPPGARRLYPVMPATQIAPGVSWQGYGSNVAMMGRGYGYVPPALLGYPRAGGYGQGYGPNMPALYGGAMPAPMPADPYGGGYSPSAGGGSPYAGGYGPGMPYDPSSYGGGSSSSYGGDYSAAYELQAYGQLGISQEQARLLREQALQAKLDTRKKLVDTLAYERDNKYTFTQEQADIAKRILERLQKAPTSAEVVSGKSLNILIQDLAKLGHLQLRGQTVTLDEELLKLLNVAASGSSGNLALLRDNGRFAWPSVFENKVFDATLRKDMDLQAQELFQQALNARLDKNLLKDLKANLRTLRDALAKNRTHLLTQEYLEGSRFLDDFDNAVEALERGAAPLNLEFHQKFAKGGKTVQELADYMNARGLTFTAAAAGDERVYYALQTALAAHSLWLHSQLAGAGKH